VDPGKGGHHFGVPGLAIGQQAFEQVERRRAARVGRIDERCKTFGQAVHVEVEVRIGANAPSLALGQRSQAGRELLGARHRCVANGDGDQRHPALDRGFDLLADEIGCCLEPPHTAVVGARRPLWTDQGQHHGLAHFLKDVGAIERFQRHAVDVLEYALATELRDEPIGDAPGRLASVRPAVRDENCLHASPPDGAHASTAPHSRHALAQIAMWVAWRWQALSDQYGEASRPVRYYPGNATIEGDIDLDALYYGDNTAGIFAQQDLVIDGTILNWEIDTTASFLAVGRDLQ
jgi:hypothetical protein